MIGAATLRQAQSLPGLDTGVNGVTFAMALVGLGVYSTVFKDESNRLRYIQPGIFLCSSLPIRAGDFRTICYVPVVVFLDYGSEFIPHSCFPRSILTFGSSPSGNLPQPGQSHFRQSQCWESLPTRPSGLGPRVGVRGELYAGVTIDTGNPKSKCDYPNLAADFLEI